MNQKTELPKNIYPIASELLDTIEGFELNELTWLTGYCVGLARGRESDVFTVGDGGANPRIGSTNELSKHPAEPETRIKTCLLYASQTGNSEAIASSLFQQIKSSEVDLSISNLDDFEVKQLSAYQRIVLVTSTHGEGEPPDDAIEFLQKLHSKRAPDLTGSEHCILALGDSSYEHFCQTGKDFELRLSQLGSRAVLPMVECDVDYQQKSEQWIERVAKLIATQSQPLSIAKNPLAISADVAAKTFSRTSPFRGTIITNQKITGNGSEKIVHHLEISLENSGIIYRPGDSIGIWPENQRSLVDEILNLTHLAGKEPVVFEGVEKSIRQALVENFELTLINKDFINGYLDLLKNCESTTQTEQQIKKIELILAKNYSQFIKDNQIVDVIRIAPIEVSANHLVELLKPIKPRMYSISSSLEENPEEIHLTVALKQSNQDEDGRFGAASHYLIQTLKEDDDVLLFVEENKRFKLPQQDRPIIMIGPGTGIAPFRSFLQQRKVQSSTGKNWLIFGNPHFNTDFLYQLELQKYHSSGLLTCLDLAFSRDQKEKIYVQDRLKENAQQIWQWLTEQDAYLYVCGDMSRMAKDVEKALLEIAIEQGNLTDQQAQSFVKNLKKENRYQRDVY